MKKRFWVLGLSLCLMCMCMMVSAAEPRAVTKPTSYAPASWYDQVHNWSCTNYTYSKYFFEETSNPVIYCEKEFTAEFYDISGKLIYEETAQWNNVESCYWINTHVDDDYYFILRNESSSAITTAEASYIIWDYE